MQTLSAKPVLENLELEIKSRVDAVTRRLGRAPKLSVILVGEDPASVIYTRRKGDAAVRLGMSHETIQLAATATPAEVKAVTDRLNRDDRVDGILIQRPLPKGFVEEEVLYWVDPSKDVDAFHPENLGRLTLGLPCFKPCTPHGIMLLLDHYGIELAGKVACVIGRSSIVGKPMAAMLLQRDATVFQTHSRSRDLPSIARQADILVVAAGKPGLVDASYVKEGAVVLDVGIHRDAQQKIIGDVRFDLVAPKCAAITPVPGGVGPMTIGVLLQNTVLSAERRAH